MSKARRYGPLYCEHANEMPAVCFCPDDCYCKSNSCKSTKEETSVEDDPEEDPVQAFVVKMKPLTDQGMSLEDAIALHGMCGLDLSLLLVHLARIYGETSRPMRLRRLTHYPSGCRGNLPPFGPLQFFKSPHDLFLALQLVDHLVTSRLSSDSGDIIIEDNLGSLYDRRQGIFQYREVKEGLSRANGISQAELTASRLEFSWAYDTWVNKAYRATGHGSDEEIMVWVVERITVHDLLRLERTCNGPVRWWRTWFRVREEPVPESREDLLREEDQLANQKRRAVLED